MAFFTQVGDWLGDLFILDPLWWREAYLWMEDNPGQASGVVITAALALLALVATVLQLFKERSDDRVPANDSVEVDYGSGEIGKVVEKIATGYGAYKGAKDIHSFFAQDAGEEPQGTPGAARGKVSDPVNEEPSHSEGDAEVDLFDDY